MKAILIGSLGILAETNVLRRMAFRRAFRDHGLSLQPSHPTPAERLTRSIPAFAAGAADRAVPLDRLLTARDHHFGRALAASPLRMRHGLSDFLDRIAHSRMRLGLVATTPTAWMISVFCGLDLPPETFDTIVTAESVVGDKPNPDCYHLAAAMLATAPENCLALEDNPMGIAAARAAGMAVADLSAPDGSATDPFATLLARNSRSDIAARS